MKIILGRRKRCNYFLDLAVAYNNNITTILSNLNPSFSEFLYSWPRTFPSQIVYKHPNQLIQISLSSTLTLQETLSILPSFLQWLAAMGVAILPDLGTLIFIPVCALIGIGFALFQWVLVSRVKLSAARDNAFNNGAKNGYNDYLIEEEEGVNDHNVVLKCAEIQNAISEGISLFSKWVVEFWTSCIPILKLNFLFITQSMDWLDKHIRMHEWKIGPFLRRITLS